MEDGEEKRERGWGLEDGEEKRKRGLLGNGRGREGGLDYGKGKGETGGYVCK